MLYWASLVAQIVKRLPTMWQTWVQDLGQEDPLEKEMATHSSILAWKLLELLLLCPIDFGKLYFSYHLS